MKRLRWDSFFADQESLKNHYADFNNVDENNDFSRKLFNDGQCFRTEKMFSR